MGALVEARRVVDPGGVLGLVGIGGAAPRILLPLEGGPQTADETAVHLCTDVLPAIVIAQHQLAAVGERLGNPGPCDMAATTGGVADDDAVGTHLDHRVLVVPLARHQRPGGPTGERQYWYGPHERQRGCQLERARRTADQAEQPVGERAHGEGGTEADRGPAQDDGPEPRLGQLHGDGRLALDHRRSHSLGLSSHRWSFRFALPSS
ncbi:hypothetical protein FM076_04000 [Streptomyces albus subsp. chlorinus]|nr:hypothetical protein [Streptomyces albus]NSC20420.1 hypothetical protein [Streptomyces albus subsp. chlorinus]